jgi:hypothetical protein
MDLNVRKCAHSAIFHRGNRRISATRLAAQQLRLRVVPGPDDTSSTVTDAVTWNERHRTPLPGAALKHVMPSSA